VKGDGKKEVEHKRTPLKLDKYKPEILSFVSSYKYGENKSYWDPLWYTTSYWAMGNI
jgi:hypothetical protein